MDRGGECIEMASGYCQFSEIKPYLQKHMILFSLLFSV